MEDEEDDIDDEAIWDSMCVTAARWCSLSTERVKAIVDLVEVVAHQTHNRDALDRLARGMRA